MQSSVALAMQALVVSLAVAVVGSVSVVVGDPPAFPPHSPPPPPPITDAFCLAQTMQANYMSSMVDFVTSEVFPADRQSSAVTFATLYPWTVGPAGYCDVDSYNTPGPLFVGTTFPFLYSTLNSSLFAMAESVAGAATVLGGAQAAQGVAAANVTLGPITNATTTNLLVSAVDLQLMCANGLTPVTLLRLVGTASVTKLDPNATFFYVASLVASSDAVPGGTLEASGACDVVPGSSSVQCTQGVPLSPGVLGASLDAMIPAIQVGINKCAVGSLILCATAAAHGLVNVDSCHYSVTFATKLQASFYINCPCVSF